MKEIRFENREAVAEALGLPAPVKFSVVGPRDEAYRDDLERALLAAFGPEAVLAREVNPSAKGRYAAYRFELMMRDIDQVEAFYRLAASVPGTRSIL